MSNVAFISGNELTVEHYNDPFTLKSSVRVSNVDRELIISDGFHSIDEIYEHRITLFIALCRLISDVNFSEGEIHKIWRSKINGDGSTWEGDFIMGIGKEKGQQITYHLPIERWEETEFALTLDQAPEFDGHSSEDVLERLKQL
jgi:hypothetical protein